MQATASDLTTAACPALTRTLSLAPHTAPDTQAMWDGYATRKTDELFRELFGGTPQLIYPAIRKAVEAHVLTIIRDVTHHLKVPH